MGMTDSAMGVAAALRALASSLLAFVIVVLCKCLSYFTPDDNGSAEWTSDVRKHKLVTLHYYCNGLC